MKQSSSLSIYVTALVSCCLTLTLIPGAMSWSTSPMKMMNQQPVGGRVMDRRSFGMWGGAAILGSSAVMKPAPALAMPSVTVKEFETLLRDASKSITLVELSGPKSETVVVTLVDGTQFSISDVVESATDPRSPLKVVATCRSYGVKTSFTSLKESLAKTTSTKRKLYRNAQVLKAAELEEAKQKRMYDDEQERLKEIFEQQQKEAMPSQSQ